ncbi:MAG: methyltransferase domain-containing protein [Patescibacteria group bacterium]
MWILYTLSFILLISFAYAANAGAPWVPTWKKDLERIVKLANLKPGETFIELGCGNGRVCLAVARKMKQAKIIGAELSLLQVCIAWLQATLSGLSNIKIKFGNAFHQDLSNIDVVYMFLMPETYQKIRDKLELELKTGARVITYVWPIPGWTPDVVDEVEGSQKIYLFKR